MPFALNLLHSNWIWLQGGYVPLRAELTVISFVNYTASILVVILSIRGELRMGGAQLRC